MRKVPESWEVVPLGAIAEINPPQPDRELEDDTLVSFVPMAAVEERTGRLDPSEAKRWGEVRKGYKRFQEGDVLFAKITPCMENGKVALAERLHGGVGAGSTEFHVVRPVGAILPRFVLHYLLQESVRRDARQVMQGAAGQLRVPESFLADLEIVLPPLREQERIVSEIDTHFTRLDAAVAALKRVRANLKRYRASVLKAACEGRLVPTEAELARREGRDYEPADVLLDRILKERRARWEAEEWARLRAQGKEPKDDRWKRRYKEPQPPDTSGLPELPEGWVWASIEQLGQVIGGITKNRQRGRLPLKVPYLRVANVYANELRLDDIEEIGVTETELQRVLLCPGDLLIVEGNGSRDQIGRVALWDGSIYPCAHQNHLIKIRLIEKDIAHYVLYWLLSPLGRSVIEDLASSTSGLYTLSLSKVAAVPVPLPPTSERHRIIDEVESRISLLDSIAGSIEVQFNRAHRLRQSILKRAFEGRLVPQDPSDEPASVLLERIRAERDSVARSGRKRRGPTKVAAVPQ